MEKRNNYRLIAEKYLSKAQYAKYKEREEKIIEIRDKYKGKFETPEDQIKSALDQFEIDSLFKHEECVEKRKEQFNSIPEEKKKEGRSKGGKKGGKKGDTEKKSEGGKNGDKKKKAEAGKKGGESTKKKTSKKVMDETGYIYDSKKQLCLLKGITMPACNYHIKKGLYKELKTK